jgi:hypothetical protein
MIPASRPASDPPLHLLARTAPLSSHGRRIRRPVARVLHYTLQKCSVWYMPELTVRQAREMLASWAADHRAVDGRRDEVIRTAAEAGLIKSEIHRLTGIARSTLDRILGTGGGDQP